MSGFGTVGDVVAHKHRKKPKQEKRWLGTLPTHCDLCGAKIEKYFVDGKTVMGPWGILCDSCHMSRGCGLGVGRGQRYMKKTVLKDTGKKGVHKRQVYFVLVAGGS